ncbi:MAG: TIGR03084 family metal-binding protein [Pseudomonadota bacterium]
MQQVDDFVAESTALYDILKPLSVADLARPTQFKDWTVAQVIQHLHIFNIMADHSLNDPDRFAEEWAKFGAAMRGGESMVSITERLLSGLTGPDLLDAWIGRVHDMAPRFAAADPRARVKWAGPEMSVRSSITARQMETWAHGQEVFDLLGIIRQDTDRIRNIAHLGAQTYGWAFANRGEPVPDPMPHIRLASPSGAIWEWGETSDTEHIQGSAVEFCQVVTQTRNIADTTLSVTGANAARWMAIAQCFAGAPEDPPAPGQRGPATR